MPTRKSSSLVLIWQVWDNLLQISDPKTRPKLTLSQLTEESGGMKQTRNIG